jgi:UDP-glucuronate 4-epimerase
MTTILVTGAAGFIGSAVAEALCIRGQDVVGIDNFNAYYDPTLKRDRAARLAGFAHPKAGAAGGRGVVRLIEGDVSDRAAVEALFREHRIDKICHLAAQAGVRYSLKDPYVYEQANNLGTLTLLEAARHHGVPTFVYASSSSVYGGNTKVPFSVDDPVEKPISLYAATKRYNELLAHTYHHLFGIRTTGLRFFTVYGPWGRPDMAAYLFTRAIVEGRPIDVYNHGRMRRDFTYISDIVAGVLAALDRDDPCAVFNLGNSATVELLHFIGVLEKKLGREAKKNFLPLQPGDVPETWADIEKSRRLLGFEPKVTVEEGLSLFVDWYRSYHS